MKRFNTTGVCIPSKHYMVDITARVGEIRRMVDDGKYFTINRARQYGKTTTLAALDKLLSDDYIVLFLDFQSIGINVFDNGALFAQGMARILLDQCEFKEVSIPGDVLDALETLNASDPARVRMDDIFRIMKRWIIRSDRPIVLIIDEVDSAPSNQVFLDFLAQLRYGYISRDTDNSPAFHSVILAGVSDVKCLEVRIREEEVAQECIPWNIAADFNIDMSLSLEGISGMLEEYEADHHTGMDTGEIAGAIRAYTDGYPFLVSRICQLIDEELVPERFGSLSEAWSMSGVDEAVKQILTENNTLFQSLTTSLNDMPDLKAFMRNILTGEIRMGYNTHVDEIARLEMYGLIKNIDYFVCVSNKIFEAMLYNLLVSE